MLLLLQSMVACTSASHHDWIVLLVLDSSVLQPCYRLAPYTACYVRSGMLLQVLLEDATAVFGQFLKYLSTGLAAAPGVNNLDSDLLYLRDPLNPYVSPNICAI